MQVICVLESLSVEFQPVCISFLLIMSSGFKLYGNNFALSYRLHLGENLKWWRKTNLDRFNWNFSNRKMALMKSLWAIGRKNSQVNKRWHLANIIYQLLLDFNAMPCHSSCDCYCWKMLMLLTTKTPNKVRYFICLCVG